MNTALKLSKCSQKQILDEIQAIDKQILINSIASDPKHLIDMVEFYQKQIQHSDPKIVDNAKLQLKSLQDIMDFKVVLTQIAFGLYDESDIVDGIQTKMDIKDNVIQMNPKIPARKDNKQVEESKYFKGYMRAKILDSHVNLPEEATKLISSADTMEKINKIAEILIKNNQEEQALNLSIDLAEKFGITKIGFPRELIEKKFVFEVLPNAKGVKLNNPEEKGLENINLVKWIEYLNDTSRLIQSKNDIIKAAVKEIKKDKQISLYTQSILDKFNGTMEIKEDILKIIASEAKVKKEDLKYEVSEKAIENTKSSNLIEFKNKILEVLKNKKSTDSIQVGWEFLKKNINEVTDYKFKSESEEDKAEQMKLWQEIIQTYKDNIGGTPVQESSERIESVVNKDKIVEEAFDKAIELEEKEKKMSIIETLIRKEAQKIVDSKDPQAINRIRKVIKDRKPELKKAGISLDAQVLFNELSKTENQSNSTIVEEQKIEKDTKPSTIPLTEKLDIQKEFPELWKEAENCETFEAFTNFIKSILIDSKKEFISVTDNKSHTPGMICCTLAIQFMNKLEACKDWDRNKIIEWWSNLKRKIACESENKAIKSPNVEKESSGTQKADDSSKKKDGKKVNPQLTEKEKEMNNLGESSASGTIVTTTVKSPIDVNTSKLGKSEATSVKKTGQNTEVTKEKTTVENLKDVKNVTNKTKVTGFVQGEVKDSQSEEQSVKESSETEKSAMSTQEKNVQNQPAGTLKEIILNASDAAGMKKNNELGESAKIDSAGKQPEKLEEISKLTGVKPVKVESKPGEESATSMKDSGKKTTENSGDQSGQDSVKENVNVDKQENVQQNIPGELGEASSGKQSQKDPGNLEKVEDSAKLNQQETVQDQSKVNSDVEKQKSNEMQPSATANSLDEFHKKYEILKKEKDIDRIKPLIKQFLSETSYLTFRERVEEVAKDYLPTCKKFSNTPKREILNFINSVVKKDKDLSITTDGLAFINEIETNNKNFQMEKNKK